MEQQDILGKKLRHIDPSIRGPGDYFDHLIAYNQTTQRAVSRGLDKFYRDLGIEGCSLITTGSDARLEKGPASSIEFIVLLDKLGDREVIEESLNAFIQEQGLKDAVEPHIEFKPLGTKEPISQCIFKRDQPDQVILISPNRIFDAVRLSGSQGLYLEAKTLLEEEMRSDEGRSILDRVLGKVREHRKVTTTGVQRYKQENLQHYNLESGISFYNPDQNLWSFKQGPLRAMQYAIVRDSIRTLRDSKTHKIFFDVPTNTVGKINALEVEGYCSLGTQAVQDFCDNYKYFLHAYHTAQMAHKEHGRVELGFDILEVKQRTKDVEQLCTQRIIVPQHL